MGFSYFHEIGILSGINILETYQIDIVNESDICNGKIVLI